MPIIFKLLRNHTVFVPKSSTEQYKTANPPRSYVKFVAVGKNLVFSGRRGGNVGINAENRIMK